MTEYNKRILKIVTDDIIDENDELFLKEIEAASADPRFANTKESDEKMKKALDEAFAVKKPRSKKALIKKLRSLPENIRQEIVAAIMNAKIADFEEA